MFILNKYIYKRVTSCTEEILQICNLNSEVLSCNSYQSFVTTVVRCCLSKLYGIFKSPSHMKLSTVYLDPKNLFKILENTAVFFH